MTQQPLSDVDGVIVFDGVCNLCSTSVRIVSAMDRAGVIKFTPTQSNFGRALCAAASVDPTDPSTFLFIRRGRPLAKSDAIVELLSRLERPWTWLRFMALLPRSWRDAVYTAVAENRYRLFGKRSACMIPGPRLQARFITEVPADRSCLG